VETVATAARMSELSHTARSCGRRIGLVPTMGALHDGHLSLATRAHAECDLVVLSIYVNPHQFGPSEDFARYPRDLERDARLAEEAGVDILFAPRDEEIHLPGHATRVEVERMQGVMCGRSRSGHFRAVTAVVAKLIGIVRPHAAYFGEKDAQQLRIIRQMTRDLHLGVQIIGCATVREEDGLALSSRNSYLTPEERRAAPILNRALQAAATRARAGETDVRRLIEMVHRTIAEEPLVRIDYVEAVDDASLQPVNEIRGRVLLGVAAWLGHTRLIDNVVIGA
jgi:pantoate--beta-alanine ligase